MYNRKQTFFEKPNPVVRLNKQGHLFVISGPSGVGKTSIINRLLSEIPKLEKIVGYTTRTMRQGEIADYTYHYISREEFQSKIQHNDFLEHLEFSDNFYGFGLSLQQVLQKLNAGVNLIVDMDYSQVEDLKSKVNSCISIFIMPPSIDDLRSRLTLRGDNPETVEKRMKYAEDIIIHASICDKIIINVSNKLEDAVNEIKDLIYDPQSVKINQTRNHQVM